MMKSGCPYAAGYENAGEALAMIREEIRQFSGAVQSALAWMKPKDAERFMRQYEWLTKKAEAAGQPDCSGEKALSVLIEAAIEAWRFERISEKAVKRMDLMGMQTFLNRYSWFLSRLDAAFSLAGVRTLDLTGETYSVGMAVTALNADEYGDEELYVARMVDPVIMAGDAVLRIGAVMLGAADER